MWGDHFCSASLPSVCHSHEYNGFAFPLLRQVYKMDSKPRGVALIINNETFNCQCPDHNCLAHRDGTDEDCEMLENLFRHKLHFDVSVLRDLTGEVTHVV